MDLKRLTEWFTSVDGLVKALLAMIGVPAVFALALTKALDPWVPKEELPAWLPLTLASLIAIGIVTVLVLSYRRYVRESRLEHPESFALRPTGPDSLIGRREDLDRLLRCVRETRLVLLDGESGCGKSALVEAGLIPTLQAKGALLPVLVREWGDDWERGPAVAALDSLHQSLSEAELDAIGWLGSPDLALDAASV